MTRLDLVFSTAPIAGILEPHRSTVAAILRATHQGLFTTAEAELLIDRIRTHVTTFPSSTGDSLRAMGSSEHMPGILPVSPNRTVS